MMKTNADLLAIERGLIVAPAGCGKTQLITELLASHTGRKPILVLTHTNAGVAALKTRLENAHISTSRYRLATLDGWALRLATSFPMRADYSIEIPAKLDYNAIRDSAIRLLERRHIADILSATYANILVDEYQDCSQRQHRIIELAAETIKTCVFGDPLQAIFGFDQSDPLASWADSVSRFFPLVLKLDTPWRWIKSNNELLGRWLLDVRLRLLNGRPIDLKTAPDCVTWVQLDGTDKDIARIINAAQWSGRNMASDRVLVIGDSKNTRSRHQIASQIRGTNVVESVDLRDMVNFAERLRLDDSCLETVLSFAETVMTGVGKANLMARLKVLINGTARKEASRVEEAAINLIRIQNYIAVAKLLSEISRDVGVRTFRPEILRGSIRALNNCHSSDNLTFHQAAIQVREQNRLLGRPLSRRSIGSTLLLKGLEAEIVVILNADNLDKSNLYVALTRGSNNLIICSRQTELSPV